MRNAVSGVRPTGKLAGEPWVNFSDMQFGVFNLAPTPLLAVRFWAAGSNYVVGDLVVSGGEIYRAVANHFNSAPPSANWALFGGAGVDSFNARTGAVTLSNADVVTVLPGSNLTPLMDGVADSGIGPAWARDDHIHPTDTTRLALTGGTMTGSLFLPPAAPTFPDEAANKDYVDNSLASLRLFLGTWEVAGNNPDLTVTGGLTAGDYYIAVTTDPIVPENAPGGVPGIGGQSISNGSLVIWNGTIFQTVRGSGLTIIEGDARYLALGGGTLTGPLVLDGDPAGPLEPVTLQFLDNIDIDAGTYN